MTIQIPAGIDDQSQLLLRGEGNVGMCGGLPGNLHVDVKVKEHDLFKRDGDDVRFELPINFAQAALGDELEVPTLDGNAILKISPGTQTGAVLVMKGKGIPRRDRSGRGDELVEVKVVTPDKLSREEREIFQELAKSLGRRKGSPKRKRRITDRWTGGSKGD